MGAGFTPGAFRLAPGLFFKADDMYADPALIRNNPIRVNFNDAEADLISALVNYTGQQRAVLIRELILEQARLVLSGQADYAPNASRNEQPQLAFNGTSEGPQ
jgi:hypothetical protein